MWFVFELHDDELIFISVPFNHLCAVNLLCAGLHHFCINKRMNLSAGFNPELFSAGFNPDWNLLWFLFPLGTCGNEDTHLSCLVLGGFSSRPFSLLRSWRLSLFAVFNLKFTLSLT